MPGRPGGSSFPADRPPFRLRLTRPADSLAWIKPDLATRLLPMTLVVGAVWLLARPQWLGLAGGDLPVQLGFGLALLPVMFVAAAWVQLGLSRSRRALRVPASHADAALQAGFYLLNAGVEEAFFRGVLQGGLSAWTGLPPAALLAATTAYVLYHRLGRWPWPDVWATALVGVPLAFAFWLLPGPPSLLGVTLAHFGATCGFLGPGPLLLRRRRLLPL